MAMKIALVGETGSGKSFGRQSIPDGENVVILAPSFKNSYLKNSQGEYLGQFDFLSPSGKHLAEMVKEYKFSSVYDFCKRVVALPAANRPLLQSLGGILKVQDMNHIPVYLDFIVKCLPTVHTIVLPDFTHYISAIIATDEFIKQKSGGAAFEKLN